MGKLRNLECMICPICHKQAQYNFCHYDHDIVNDCLDYKLRFDPEENKWILPEDSRIGCRYVTRGQTREINSCCKIIKEKHHE